MERFSKLKDLPDIGAEQDSQAQPLDEFRTQLLASAELHADPPPPEVLVVRSGAEAVG